MEVHHHSHSNSHGKSWKVYFFEFFMLFLAVTLGFYAETLRETIKEKEKLHLDMESILTDLYSDASYLDSVYMRNEFSCEMCDSLITLLNSDRPNTSNVYYFARAATANISYFYSNSKTYDQMKSSGTLKFITPRILLDSLSYYYSSFQWLAQQTELHKLKVDAIHKGNKSLFNAYLFQQMMQINYIGMDRVGTTRTIINRPEGNPKLLSNDPTVINDVMMNYHYYYTTAKFLDRAGLIRQQQAMRLIEMIKKEYPSE